MLYAAREGCVDCVKALIEGKANVDLQDPEGVTPLTMAVSNMHFDAAAVLIKAGANQVTAFAKAPSGALYASTSNLGKVFILSEAPDAKGSYESDVFDAHVFSKWGRAEFRGRGNVELFARSGNVDNPDRNWSVWRKVDLEKDSTLAIPAARFAPFFSPT